MNPPCQELVAKDLHGSEWKFRHIYRGNTQPKHALTDDMLRYVAWVDCPSGYSMFLKFSSVARE